MKHMSLWFALFSCAVLASLLPESCTKKNGVLDPQSLSKTSTLAVEKTSTITPPANPVIAYVVSGKLNTRNIMVMNADGSNQTVVVNGTLATVGGLSWAPTSSINPNINHIAYGQGNNMGIRIVDVAVVNGKPTASNDHQLSGLGGLSNIGSPKWSPLGTRIAFGAGDSNSSNIYITAPDGGTAPLLVYTAATGYICTDYAWSPDGSKLLINEMTALGPILNNVRELDLNTTTTYTLIQGDYDGWRNITCSPDGLHIAYNGHTSSKVPSIYYVSADFTTIPLNIGSQLKVVDGSSPSWSPDNLMLLFEGGKVSGINYYPGGENTYTFSSGTIKNISTTGLWSDWRR